MQQLIFGIGLALVIAGSAQAATWASADGLYEQRENNPTAVKQARAEYKELLAAATSKADKIRAVSQLGRLAIYEGVMLLPESDRRGRKAVFKDCADGFALEISPDNIGEQHPAYFYFRGVCLAYWGKAAGTLASLPRVPTILNLIEGGLEVDTRFEGGGIYRLAAGIYQNPQAQPLGLYDPEKSLAMIDKALAAAAYPGDPNRGSLWFDNWRAKGLALKELGRTAEAISLLEGKLEEIEELVEEEELPEGREPETKWNGSMMATHIDDWN